MDNIFIGTSNIVIPGNKTTFPDGFQSATRLHYYSHLFNSVEVNSSFYKTPLRSTFEKWAADTGDNFRFSVKLSRDVTHHKTLEADTTLIKKFIGAAEGIGHKKGCLLIQFPGKITIRYFSQVENILQQINTGWRIAVEFRHPSWYIAETNELLHLHKAAIVYHDHPKAKIFAAELNADFIYIRFHGEAGDYRGSYTAQFLKQQADAARKYTQQGKDVFMYFNNTIGDAFHNARYMQTLLNK
jgi:uncharacterized protein YecE (DUF72 family)